VCRHVAGRLRWFGNGQETLMRAALRSIGIVGIVAACLVVTGTAQTSAIDKAYFGTWKLNVAKSKYEPGPGPKESTRVHEDRGSGFVLITTTGTNQRGEKNSSMYVYKPDGKDYPVAAKNQTVVATIALRAIDPYTVEFDQKVDGKIVSSGKRVVSKDGQTMTITTKGTNQQGQPTSSSAVWEKVAGRPATH